MKAALLLAVAAAFSAQAGAQVSGFVQLRQVQRTGSAAECPPSGCGAMVEEGLAELLFERRLDASLAMSVRAQAAHDAISHDQTVGLREATLAWQPVADLDVKAGRQIITWGVSDYLYVNDIFPKNYDTFFTGGSFDRIKEPVDAVHLAWHGPADFELVVARPKADRMPSPARFVAVAAALNARQADETHDAKVDIALKASRSVGGWDLAAYAARQTSREQRVFVDGAGLRFDRPRLWHLGASATGNAAGGVMWMEAAARHVEGNRQGVVDRHFPGSTAKFIFGYSRVVTEDVTASAQVQVESALDRRQYVQSLVPGVRPVGAFNPVLHLRVAGHWVNQTVGAGAQLFAGAEGDTHFNPFASWSPVDGWTLEAGANLFRGRPDTRFGTLRHDSNFYTAARFSY
jgi:hypothetical protein